MNIESRFHFGRNWQNYLDNITPRQIAQAEESLKFMLNYAPLENIRFLDAGSGSGLFSLAARRAGATVHSFDLDPDSVACTKRLRGRIFPQ